MNHLEYYVVYHLDRGKNESVRVSTINYLTKNEAEEKVKRIKQQEPNLLSEPKIYEYRY